jgi:CelD/BcsL family acetyltransferase involved in cellulose biosynthesis
MISLRGEASQQESPVNPRVWLRTANPSAACVYELDPLRDRRWPSFLQRHAHASIFHHVDWLNALSRTYGYEPVVFTSTRQGVALENGLLFCRIRSWVTGNRIVSLPFSDYCAPLCDPQNEFDSLISPLLTPKFPEEWKYLEVRPLNESFRDGVQRLGFKSAGNYILHRVDLEPATEEIFRRLDKDSVRRRVRHAERVGVAEVCGKSQALLKDFFQLMVRTRARHNLPPQPYAWFRNLLDCMREAADLRLAYLNDIPVAGVLVLHFKDTSYYKYGCSDERFHKFGGMPFLLWRAILKAKSLGSRTFDLGRTANHNLALIAFKNHWTPTRESLTYWRFPPQRSANLTSDWKLMAVKRACAHMPQHVLIAAGSMLYRHIG